jgi:hypothetical protein
MQREDFGPLSWRVARFGNFDYSPYMIDATKPDDAIRGFVLNRRHLGYWLVRLKQALWYRAMMTLLGLGL